MVIQAFVTAMRLIIVIWKYITQTSTIATKAAAAAAGEQQAGMHRCIPHMLMWAIGIPAAIKSFTTKA
jgi:hypothetical protein